MYYYLFLCKNITRCVPLQLSSTWERGRGEGDLLEEMWNKIALPTKDQCDYFKPKGQAQNRQCYYRFGGTGAKSSVDTGGLRSLPFKALSAEEKVWKHTGWIQE